MATYYETKSYVVSLTRSISEELKIKNSKVKISALCPGPVNTNFNNVANVKFSLQGLSSEYVAKYAIDQMLAGKKIIIPGFQIKALAFISKIIPTNVLLNMTYKSQKRKGDK
jgi:short-subunit dehydrogenase